MVSLSDLTLKEWPSPGGQDAPPIPSRRRSSQRPEWANPSLLARLPGSASRSSGTPCPPPLSCARERRRFRLMKASETFCVLGAYTATRKKSNGHPRKAKRCALPCSQMAKAELHGVLRSSPYSAPECLVLLG